MLRRAENGDTGEFAVTENSEADGCRWKTAQVMMLGDPTGGKFYGDDFDVVTARVEEDLLLEKQCFTLAPSLS